MDNNDPIIIKLKGEHGTVEYVLPYVYVKYYTRKSTDEVTDVVIQQAIALYKGLK